MNIELGDLVWNLLWIWDRECVWYKWIYCLFGKKFKDFYVSGLGVGIIIYVGEEVGVFFFLVWKLLEIKILYVEELNYNILMGKEF